MSTTEEIEARRQRAEQQQAALQRASTVIKQGEGKNERGIPAVTFVQDVGAYLKEKDLKIEILFEALTVLRRKYENMMHFMQQNKQVAQKQVPEVRRTLEAVKHLIKAADEEKELKTSFSLSDGVYSDATIDTKQGSVFLALGANVLLEYVQKMLYLKIFVRIFRTDVKVYIYSTYFVTGIRTPKPHHYCKNSCLVPKQKLKSILQILCFYAIK